MIHQHLGDASPITHLHCQPFYYYIIIHNCQIGVTLPWLFHDNPVSFKCFIGRLHLHPKPTSRSLYRVSFPNSQFISLKRITIEVHIESLGNARIPLCNISQIFLARFTEYHYPFRHAKPHQAIRPPRLSFIKLPQEIATGWGFSIMDGRCPRLAAVVLSAHCYQNSGSATPTENPDSPSMRIYVLGKSV